jgi:hypothetical protein
MAGVYRPSPGAPHNRHTGGVCCSCRLDDDTAEPYTCLACAVNTCAGCSTIRVLALFSLCPLPLLLFLRAEGSAASIYTCIYTFFWPPGVLARRSFLDFVTLIAISTTPRKSSSAPFIGAPYLLRPLKVSAPAGSHCASLSPAAAAPAPVSPSGCTFGFRLHCSIPVAVPSPPCHQTSVRATLPSLRYPRPSGGQLRDPTLSSRRAKPPVGLS